MGDVVTESEILGFVVAPEMAGVASTPRFRVVAHRTLDVGRSVETLEVPARGKGSGGKCGRALRSESTVVDGRPFSTHQFSWDRVVLGEERKAAEVALVGLRLCAEGKLDAAGHEP